MNEENVAQNVPDKDNKGIIIATITGVSLVFAAAIIGVAISMSQGSNNPGGQDDLNYSVAASSRDTQRRDDLAVVATKIIMYQSNNRGMLPKGPSYYKGSSSLNCGDADTACRFVKNYLSSNSSANDFRDPSGVLYSLYITENLVEGSITTSYGSNNSKLVEKGSGYTIGGNSPFSEHTLFLIPGATCDDTIAVKSSSKRDYALLYQLEVNNGIYCMTNY